MEAESRRTALPDLVAVASPDLYRRNAFRVCGLPVDANPRQVRRRQDEVRAAVRLGRPVPGRGGLLALDPAPDAAEVEDALQRLRDPVHRIVQELFWFWPQPDDPADPDALQRHWRQRVARGKSERAADGKRGSGLAAHNVAVLAHATALDRSGMGGLDEEAWRDAYRNWRRVMADHDCWQHLEQRIRALDDVRLWPEIAARLREQLPAALLRVHAEVAIRTASDGERAIARRHVALIRASGLDAGLARRALAESAEPVAARLRARCDRIRPGGDPNVLSSAAGSLLADTEPDLTILRLALGDTDPVTVGAADEVATRVNGYAVAAANAAARKLATTKKQLSGVRTLPISTQVRSRVEQNLGTLVANQIVAACEQAVKRAEAQPRIGPDHVTRLLDMARPLLVELGSLPIDKGLRNELHDDVASAVLIVLSKYVEAAGDRTTAWRQLLKAEPLAMSPELRETVQRALRDLKPAPSPDLDALINGRLSPEQTRSLVEMLQSLEEAGLEVHQDQWNAAPPMPRVCPLCAEVGGPAMRCTVTLHKNNRAQTVKVDCCWACWLDTLRRRRSWAPVAMGGAVVMTLLADWLARGWVQGLMDIVVSVALLLGLVLSIVNDRRVDAGRRLLANNGRIAALARDGWRIDSWRDT